MPNNNTNNAGYSESNFPANTWGYNSNGSTRAFATNTNYFPLSTTSTLIDSTNTTTNSHETTIGLAAKVDFTASSGAYIKDLIITMTANPTVFAVTYDANGSTIGSYSSVTVQCNYGFPGFRLIDGIVSETCDGMHILMTDDEWSRSFLGWFTEPEGGEQVTTDTIITSNVTFYAHWSKTTFEKAFYHAGARTHYAYYCDDEECYYRDLYAMQDMTPEICSYVDALDDEGQIMRAPLIDLRDNQVYEVSKFANRGYEACWMTQDLAFTGTATPADSDVENVFDFDRNYFYDTYDEDWWYEQVDNNGYCEPGDTCVLTYLDPNTGFESTYYNWYAATAGTSSSYYGPSICPKGWTLPRIDDFRSLTRRVLPSFGGINAFSPSFAGFIRYYDIDYDRVPYPLEQNIEALLWTGEGINNISGPYFNLREAIEDVGTEDFGLPVRCIVRQR